MFPRSLPTPVALIVAMVCVGCLSDVRPDDPETLQIFSWWASDSESDALKALLAVYAEKEPRVEVVNAADSLAEKARDRLVDRLSTFQPPDTFQANIGRNLTSWVYFNERDTAESKLEDIRSLAAANGWFDAFPPRVIDLLSGDGGFYGVPVNIHRINSMFYNKRVMDRLGLEPPKDLDDLHELLELLMEAGYRYPLSIGNRAEWPATTFAMENVFPAVAGPEYFRSYWRGGETADSPEMRATLEELLYLWQFIDPDVAEKWDWTDGTRHIFDKKPDGAVLTVMGDWAKGHLQAEGFRPGVDFDEIPFPGTRGTFVFTADCFPLPKGAPNRAAAISLLETFGSKQGQLAFNPIKGSIPARQDIKPELLDEVARGTWRNFASNELLLALSGVLDPDFTPILQQAVIDTLADQDPDPVLFAVRNNYSRFSPLPQER